MSAFPFHRSETTELVAHRAFRLVDAVTGQAPLGVVRAFLDREGPGNTWEPTDIEPVVTGSGILFYGSLERSDDVLGEPPRRYRFRMESDRYLPEYQMQFDGIEFDAFPYNDDVVANPFATTVDVVLLFPAPLYAFPAEVPLLRGTVLRLANGARVPYATVTKPDPNNPFVIEETALTDARGEFVLPLRQVVVPSAGTVSFDIDVIDKRTNEARTKTIVVPAMLGINVVIDIL